MGGNPNVITKKAGPSAKFSPSQKKSVNFPQHKKQVQHFPHLLIRFIFNNTKHKHIYKIILLIFITVNTNNFVS